MVADLDRSSSEVGSVRLPWQTKEDAVLSLIDRAIEEARQRREEHEEALRMLRDALKDGNHDAD